MSKVAVVYWSRTGNTQAMADAVADGANLVATGVIANNTPDDEALSSCEELGSVLAK